MLKYKKMSFSKIKTKGHCSKIGEYSQLIINEIFKA